MTNESTRPGTVLVTGASGLIGARICERLSSSHTVVGLDVDPPPDTLRHLEWLTCDLTRDESVSQALGAVRERHGDRLASVIHLAAYYDFSGAPSPLYQKLTVDGTARLLRILQRFHVEQFVFSSSLLVMEPAEPDEQIGEQSPLEDEPWYYPKSKIEAERVIWREHGSIPAVILRLAGVYDEDGHSIPLGQQLKRIHEKSIESYFFPGEADRGQPYIHLADLTDCVEQVVERRRELGSDTFLIAEPDIVTYGELQDRLGDLLHGKEWPTIRIPKAAAKVGAWARERLAGEDEPTFIKPWMVDLADAHYPVAIAHARERLGWIPRHRLRDTLSEIVRRFTQDPRGWYERNGLATERRAARGK
jgi:nucleoside-diphosphate-sugar epimerase